MGMTERIVIAVVLSVLQFFERSWRPYSAVLGKVEGLPGYHDLTRYPDGQQIPVSLVLEGAAPSLGGTVAAMGSEPLAVSSAAVSGTTVEVSFDSTGLGMPGTITFTLEISGERAEGNGTSPSGPFTISGSRTARPEVTP